MINNNNKKQNSQGSLLNAVFKPVEGILVCTGVYNPQNDYLFHLRSLFNQSMHVSTDDNNKLDKSITSTTSTTDEDVESGVADLSITVPTSTSTTTNPAHTHSSSLILRDSNAVSELQEALSRRNSFINYFDNKLNVPDVTVPNLLDAVNYIIQSIKK